MVRNEKVLGPSFRNLLTQILPSCQPVGATSDRKQQNQ
jgi:hypothetical protein